MRQCADCPTPVTPPRRRCPACAVKRDNALRRLRYAMDRERELAQARRRYRRHRRQIRARQNAAWQSRTTRPVAEREAHRRYMRALYQQRKAAA